MLVARMLGVALLLMAFETAWAADQTISPNRRDALKIMVSPLQTTSAQVVSARLVQKYTMPPPDLATVLTGAAVTAFCAGVGSGTPDVIGIPRQMTKREYDTCVENGVVDIIELAVGFDALVLAVRKGDPVFNVTPRAIYFALAAQIPHNDEFVPNSATHWNEIDLRLPDQEIFVVGSESGTALNTFFKEIFMEGGCRSLHSFKVFYSAKDRVKMCTTLRADGRFIGIPAPIAVNFKVVLRAAPAGTVAVLPYTVYQANADWLDVLPVSGVYPTAATIKDDDYEAVTPVRFYVKRQHMETSLGGMAVTRGLYYFIEEIMSEESIGPGGYLESLGLVIDDAEDRQRDRDQAMRLQPFRR